MLQYGLDFLKQLEPVYTAPETKNGECAEVRECIAHQTKSIHFHHSIRQHPVIQTLFVILHTEYNMVCHLGINVCHLAPEYNMVCDLGINVRHLAY